MPHPNFTISHISTSSIRSKLPYWRMYTHLTFNRTNAMNHLQLWLGTLHGIRNQTGGVHTLVQLYTHYEPLRQRRPAMLDVRPYQRVGALWTITLDLLSWCVAISLRLRFLPMPPILQTALPIVTHKSLCCPYSYARIYILLQHWHDPLNRLVQKDSSGHEVARAGCL